MFRQVAFFLATSLAIASWSVATAGATGTWSVVPSPNGRVPAEAELMGVSCSSAIWCVAVGNIHVVGPPSHNATLIEAFDGTHWVTRPSPNAVGQQDSYLTHVSCSSATSCEAIGYSATGGRPARRLAERWNGSTWSIDVTPIPTGMSNAQFNDVACVSATNCTIVGDTWSDSTSSALIEHWNGSAWSIAATPNAPGGFEGELNGVSCASTSSCKAVGWSNGPAEYGIGVFVESWNGTTWSNQPIAGDPTAAIEQLNSVSCTAPTNCVAVGARSDNRNAIAERWNGTQWSATSAFPIQGAAATSVSCTSATSCIATLQGGGEGAVRYDGSTWSPTAPVGDFLNGVACVSATNCTAVGRRAFGGPFGIAIADHWNGTQWSAVPGMQAIGDSYSSLSGVRCIAASDCVAVGSIVTNGGSAPLAERWNGSTWSAQPVPAPPSAAGDPANYGVLNGVACPSATRCVAVGSHGDDLEYAPNALVEVWNGSSWAIQAVPKPANLSLFSSIACPSTSRCFAVGGMRSSDSDVVHLLVEQWNGTTWSKMTVPSTGLYYSSLLEGIACVSTSNCTAVGGAANTNYQTLIEHWNGSTWTVQPSPPSPAPNSIQLNGVTCTSAANCVAVGGVHHSDGYYAPLFERWNGTTWSIQSISPSTEFGTSLTNVACLSANDCNAVGVGANVVHWNGTQWKLQPVPIPNGLTGAGLSGVSCAGGHCTAVGFAGGKATQHNHVTYIVRSS